MVEIRVAGKADAAALAGLSRLWHRERGGAETDPAGFVDSFGRWMRDTAGTHVPFIAVDREDAVGMAWLAVVPRPPHPGDDGRRHGDLQSVYVVPEHRNAGVGSGLVEAALDHARRSGIRRVTVQSGSRSLPFYARHGFTASERLLQRDP